MDRVFDETVTQAELFQEIGEPILKNFIGGYNCTIFCYGQTGAGKTHTMMGPLDQLLRKNPLLMD
jgi:chromosomal replication initiation ATPase DnaA